MNRNIQTQQNTANFMYDMLHMHQLETTTKTTYSKHCAKDECKWRLDGTLSECHYATNHNEIPFTGVHFYQSPHRWIWQFFLLKHITQCENCEKITGGLANMGRGAASADGGWRGVSPSPLMVGPGEGAVVPLPNNGGPGEGAVPLPRNFF